MTATHFDEFYVNPTRKLLTEKVQQAVDMVNKFGPNATRAPPINEIWLAPEGRVETNGGGKTKRLQFSNIGARVAIPVSTSRIGVAWWTDCNGLKHVRVVADRVDVIGRTIESVFGPWTQDKPCFWLVYPGISELVKVGDTFCLYITCPCGFRNKLDEMRWDGKRCFRCRDIENYERENGFKPGW